VATEESNVGEYWLEKQPGEGLVRVALPVVATEVISYAVEVHHKSEAPGPKPRLASEQAQLESDFDLLEPLVGSVEAFEGAVDAGVMDVVDAEAEAVDAGAVGVADAADAAAVDAVDAADAVGAVGADAVDALGADVVNGMDEMDEVDE
jgi:hypothetical protein